MRVSNDEPNIALLAPGRFCEGETAIETLFQRCIFPPFDPMVDMQRRPCRTNGLRVAIGSDFFSGVVWLVNKTAMKEPETGTVFFSVCLADSASSRARSSHLVLLPEKK